jgi:hypothetical protein
MTLMFFGILLMAGGGIVLLLGMAIWLVLLGNDRWTD